MKKYSLKNFYFLKLVFFLSKLVFMYSKCVYFSHSSILEFGRGSYHHAVSLDVTRPLQAPGCTNSIGGSWPRRRSADLSKMSESFPLENNLYLNANAVPLNFILVELCSVELPYNVTSWDRRKSVVIDELWL